MTHPSDQSGTLFALPSDAQEGEEALTCVEGVLETITYQNPENGFVIARLKVGRERVTVLGDFINPVPGEAFQVWGKWETHKQYGPQLRVVRYQVLKPTTLDGMEKYLGGGTIKGIGPKTAVQLVGTFGLETLDIIEKHPERLLEVPGIGAKKAADIVKAWAEQYEVRHIMLFLQGHGISAAYASKIYRTYGDRAIEMVTENPYRLAHDVFGIGFKLADRIARKLGFHRDRPERVEAGVLHCLQTASDNGHCFLPEAELAQGAADLLSSTPEEDAPQEGELPTAEAAEDAIERLVRAQHLIRDTEAPRQMPIYLKPVFLVERGLALNLKAMLADDHAPDWLPRDVTAFAEVVCNELGVTLAPLQFDAVVEGLRSRVLVLTGGPGTGKTTTTRAILQAHLQCKRKVLLASPTGRAAKRLAEVTGYPAQTMHRLLEVDPQSFTFKRNQQNPLECDTLIVDEVSMVDLQLAHALVRALPDGAQLILVGDADQLPSVGAGNVLHDLIRCGSVPVVRLTEIFRQAAESTIITNAHKVNHGEMPELVPTNQWQSADCLFIAQDDPLAAAQKVCDVVSRSLPTLGFSPQEIQVLVPMIRGSLGAQQLNTQLQEALNPRQIGVAEMVRGQKTLRCGDRVIQTVNNYDKDVFNGDIGYIRHVDLDEGELIVAYPEKEVKYPFEDTDELQLAYALTVHKSQGSEYPAVVVALHTQHYLLLQRNLLYTALTRAKKTAILLGSKRAVAMAVRNVSRQERYTRLAERIQEG
jgi:exodeoxyribonuclease V alpha subunit